MSQKSSPKSPRSPRSKSPSCDDGQQGGAENIPAADEIQEAVAEELRSPDRIISQAQQSMTESRGAPATYTSPQNRGSYQATGAQSRVSYHPSASSRPPTAPSSRVPSLRGAATYEEEPPHKTSPPVTPTNYGSRAAFPGNARTPSPEGSTQRSRPTSYLEIAQNPEQNTDDCPDERRSPHPDSSQYMRGPSQPVMRGTPPASHPSMRGVSATSHPSMRGSPAYSHPSKREMTGPSHASVRQSPSAYPSMREEAVPSNRGMPIGSRSAAMDNGVGSSVVTFGNQASIPYVQEDPSAMSHRTAGPATYSRQTVAGIGLSTSDLTGGGVDAATSAMSYIPNERSAAVAGCIPGCKTFMRDIQNAPASTPYYGGREPMYDQPQFGYQRQSPIDFSQAAGGRVPQSPIDFPQAAGGRAPQSSMDHHMMAHDSGYHSHSGPTSSSDRGATPPGYQGYRRPTPADGEHHHHHHAEGHEGPPQRDERVVAALGHLSQFKKTPSYFRCGLGDDLDFLKVCCTGAKEAGRTPGKVAAFPEIPCLRQEDIDELIKCETADVETTWFLTSDERKTYKKPCPKQQKAQMTVKALVQAHAAQSCGKEYSPLEHPDPEDISPEVAAAMMFSQEKGIKMEECPHYTITSLFPDEPKSPFPEKIPASSISIVDRNSKDQEEMIEKSASVPSEGVSDSAYTRTMKEKGSEEMGAQKSFDVDFAIGQSKREYVLVAQKPQRVNKVQFRGGNSPPWFPGYFSAFPDEEGLKVASSPSDLLHKAWIHSNPANMPSSDVIVLE